MMTSRQGLRDTRYASARPAPIGEGLCLLQPAHHSLGHHTLALVRTLAGTGQFVTSLESIHRQTQIAAPLPGKRRRGSNRIQAGLAAVSGTDRARFPHKGPGAIRLIDESTASRPDLPGQINCPPDVGGTQARRDRGYLAHSAGLFPAIDKPTPSLNKTPFTKPGVTPAS